MTCPFFFLVHSDSVVLGEGFILPPVFSVSLDRQIDNHWMKVKLLKSVSHSVLTDFLQPHGQVAQQAPLSMGFFRQEYWRGQPFPSPADLPNPGIEPGLPHCRQIVYHLRHEVKVKVTQLSPTLSDPIDYTVHGILQARILEWVAFPFSRGSSQPRDLTQVSHNIGRFFTS